MKRSYSLFTAALWMGGILLSAPLAQAQYIWNTNNHGDIGIEWEEDEQAFHPHWHIGSEEYDAGDAIAVGTPNVYTGIAGWTSIIGTSTGLAFFGAGYSGPNPGFGSHGLSSGDWVNGTVTLTLSGWSGPGHFALVTPEPPNLWDSYLSTYENKMVLEFDHLPIHEHFSWVFSDYGNYNLTLTWEAEHVVYGTISATDTFEVQVVPEPGTWAMLAVGGAVFLIVGRRRWVKRAALG